MLSLSIKLSKNISTPGQPPNTMFRVEFRILSQLRMCKSPLTLQVVQRRSQHDRLDGMKKSTSSKGMSVEQRPKSFDGLNVNKESEKRLEKEEFGSVSVNRVERRLQAMAVLAYTLPLMVAPLLCPMLFIFTLTTKLAPIAVGYAAWIYYDINVRKTSSRGGRASDWVRRSRVWVYYKNYFPMSLVKTAELDPGKNYLFGYHPHGILACSRFVNFATEATNFSGVFPGIKPQVLALKSSHWIPVLRSLLKPCGVCDTSRESIEWILTKQGTGNAAIIAVGGVEDMLQAYPGSYNIVLKNRKGFVKMAIQTGACLVPVFSFGENDLFVQADNPRGSYLRSFQEAFKSIVGAVPPIFQTFGVLPFRRPVHTVIGHPIEVEKVVDPDQSTIDHVHQQYMNALNELFDKHKVKYGVDSNVTLNFI